MKSAKKREYRNENMSPRVKLRRVSESLINRELSKTERGKPRKGENEDFKRSVNRRKLTHVKKELIEDEQQSEQQKKFCPEKTEENGASLKRRMNGDCEEIAPRKYSLRLRKRKALEVLGNDEEDATSSATGSTSGPKFKEEEKPQTSFVEKQVAKGSSKPAKMAQVLVTKNHKTKTLKEVTPPDLGNDKENERKGNVIIEEAKDVSKVPGKKKKAKGCGKRNQSRNETRAIEGGEKPSSSKPKSGAPNLAVERVLVKKGVAAVDGLCPIASSSHVYVEGKDVWDCLLNQTNIQFNNNKYYIIQLLEGDDASVYSVWMRWGRVGRNGQNCLQPFGSSLEGAKTAFRNKFSAKTLNEWEMRDDFEKVPGKYDLLLMDYSDGNDEVDAKREATAKEEVKSKLDEKVKALVELICNIKAMERIVKEMKYDAQKAPLGKLTSAQVKAGYAALKQIESIINGGKINERLLLEACNAFYTRIPHFFGMRVPPLIRHPEEVQEKMTLLQTLDDIQVAMDVINSPIVSGAENPVDRRYNGLDCEIIPLDKNSVEFKTLHRYLMTTQGKTHTMYKITVVEIYKLSKTSENERFQDFGNRMLLWHGSRMSNWAGILKRGLRIAPPEAPTTGYMFGKGIYFADMSSKSANYCMPGSEDVGLMVLCDVSLGGCNELLSADYEADRHLPAKFHSVKGLGRNTPDPKNFVQMSDGVTVPMGPSIDSGVRSNGQGGYVLQYNEYVVYNVNQARMKYLFQIQFRMNK